MLLWFSFCLVWFFKPPAKYRCFEDLVLCGVCSAAEEVRVRGKDDPVQEGGSAQGCELPLGLGAFNPSLVVCDVQGEVRQRPQVISESKE